MNTISIILYTINLLSNITSLLGVLIFISSIATLITFLFFCTTRNDVLIGYDDETGYYSKWNDFHRSLLKTLLTILVVSVIINTIIPNERTLTLIAASETSEFFLNTQTGQQVANQVTGLSGDATKLLGKYIELQNVKLTQDIEKLTKEVTK